MPFVLLVSLAVLLSNGALSAFAATPVSPSVTYDPAAERKLLGLANQARVQAGLTPLRADEGLTEAARQHAAAIAERQQLSHQLPGERPLAQRLTASTHLHPYRRSRHFRHRAPDADWCSQSNAPPEAALREADANAAVIPQ